MSRSEDAHVLPVAADVVHMDLEPASLSGLLVRMSTALMATSVDGHNGAMRDALALLAEHTGADRAGVLLSGDSGELAVAYRWARPGVEPLPMRADAAEGGISDAWRARLAAGEVVGVASVASLPDSAGTERRALADRGVRSLVLAPLRAGGVLLGALRLDSVHAERTDLDALSAPVRAAAELIAAGVVRSREVAALVESERRYRRVLDDVGAVVVRVGPDGRIVYVNRAWRELTGIPEAEMIGKDAMHHVHPEDRQIAAEHLAAAMSGREHEYREVRFLTPTGHRWMEVKGRAVFDETGGLAGFAGTMHDVTERRQAELRAHAARDRAEQAREHAERVSRAKSEFLSRMSHELRTPLNAILGFTQLLEFSITNEEDVDNLAHITRAGRHLLDLINDALDVSGIETGRFALSLEPTPVAALVNESLDLVRTAATNRSVRLRGVSAERNDPYVVADAQRLKQVLVNLLSNAVKYNRVGGTVTVDCYPLTLETPPGGDAEHGWLRLSVSDTGIGIPPDRLDDVFLPFERIGAEYTDVEGTGLGLAVTKSLVEAMGGHISVHSIHGVGATFQVDLPAARQPGTAVVDGTADDATEEPGPRHTVLYVEDNPSNVMLVRRLLTRRPAVRLVVACDGAAGLTLFREHRPDLVLLDLHLPQMDGAQVLAAVRGEHDEALRSTPVVMVTADLTPGTERRLLDAGATAFLGKPLDVHELLGTVDRYLEPDRLAAA